MNLSLLDRFLYMLDSLVAGSFPYEKMSLIRSLGPEDIKQKDRMELRKEQQLLWGLDKSS